MPNGRWFNRGRYPADLDRGSIGLLATQADYHVVQSDFDEMLQYLTGGSITVTWFDAERPGSTDPIIYLNVLTLFYSSAGRSQAPSLPMRNEVLRDDPCFSSSPRDETLHARLAELLRGRVLERAGCQGDALALAMRVLVGVAVYLRMEHELAALLPLQCEDGG